MKLTDQEQVILKAIGHGVAQVSQVIRAVGYPKATVKKVLARLNEKGIVALHRHDYPQSLTAAQRKLMLRLRDGQGHWHYYNAVTVMKRNPKGKHLRGATAKQERQYEHILESAKKYHRYGKRKKEVAARTVKARQNPKKSGKGKEALKTTGRALKSAARGILGAGSQILGAGAKALNPVRRKVRNKYIDLVIKGQAKKTPDGWRVGKKTFAQGRGTVSVSSGYYLDRATGLVYAKRTRNTAKKKAGKHASRASRAGKTSSRRSRRVATKTRRNASTAGPKKRLASKRKASATARRRSLVKSRKAPASRATARKNPVRKGMRKLYGQARALQRHDPKRKSILRKAARRGKQIMRKVGRKNPSAESIRKKFAGRVSGERDVFVPASAPKGKLAKLGNLVSITTEEGTIKPVHGSAVLLADTRGRLHVGSLSGAPLFGGPRRSFGAVKRIEYDDSKPHLGFPNPIIWHHKLGEESGHRPTLHADGQGGLVFRGGCYRLTARGIEN